MPGTGDFADDKILPTSTPVKIADQGSLTPYNIEGQAANRVVTYKIIPKYPEGLQKQATVKISFTILANGQVGEMRPLIRADARLEKITLDAFRQWRFNPVTGDRKETGVITFRYLLK